MYIFITSGVDELSLKKRWFRKPICKEIQKRGINFGFQIQGPFSTDLEKIGFPYGIHLPNNIANDLLAGDRSSEALEVIGRFMSLAPSSMFAVIHGNRIGAAGEQEYREAFDKLIALLKYLKSLGIPVTLENTAFTNFLFEEGVWKPETYLDLRIGSLSQDMLDVRNQAGCDLLVDIEHLAFAANFAKESGLREEASHIYRVNGEVNLYSEIEAIDAQFYHFAGSYPEGWMEIRDGKVASHAPITTDDMHVMDFLKFAISQDMKKDGKVVIIPEVSGSDNLCWAGRPKDAQETSFENVCQMVLQLI